MFGREANIDDFQTKFSKKFDDAMYAANYNIISGSYDVAVGSGRNYMKVSIPLRNRNSTATKVTFPARLIARSSTGERRHGILLKNSSVIVPANSLYEVMLVMYCGNIHEDTSHGGLHDKLIVSDSDTLKDLTQRLANKKINVEEYSDDESDVYWEIACVLQNIVWSVTNGSGLSQAKKDWIAALPNIF
ncbi:MAG: hypothetical protein LBS73_04560 [Campylobacteraceae bacterium]|jgi:hypothetical protein|nr:hypothetical protein [Campylobacteraceae bacterium]